jgi:hypothetical protein
VDGCLEHALTEALRRGHSAPKRPAAPHRVPLGLLLLSRQHLTAEQLRAGLAAQRAAGRGKVGEWLQALGFVNEQQVTAALAWQWSCPVLQSQSLPPPGLERTPRIPVALLESLLMVPVAWVKATATLHIAFGDGIDYSVLYALEQVLRCHAEPCLAVPSLVRKRMQALREHRGEDEILFDRVTDVGEFARIVHSYSARMAASEIRMATCGSHVWVRLLCPARRPFDLLLHLPRENAAPTSQPEPAIVATG